MTEQAVMQWFAMHPFWRNEVVLVLGAWSSYAEADWSNFKKYKEFEPGAAFSLRVAARTYAKVLLVAGLPPLVGEVWKILGVTEPVLSAAFHFVRQWFA